MAETLNRTYALEKIKMPYPHVKVLVPSDALALMVPSLPKGDLAVICEYQGTVRKLASVAYSAVTLNNLSKVSKLELCKDECSCIALSSTLEIMEAMC